MSAPFKSLIPWFFLFFGLFVWTQGNSQCYIQLGDYSGFDTSPYLDTLEAAACDLIRSLPSEFQNPRLQSLTLLDLLNHNVPFPRRPSGFGEFEEDPQNPYQYYSKQNLLRYFARYVPVKGMSEFSYSHINYALLEIVIESATGLTFGDALDNYVLQPLGMDNSCLLYTSRCV